MALKKATFCPLIKKDCIENKCLWFTQVRGRNPNTGEPVDEWQCAVNLLPLLLIENAQQQRSTAAAVESFRNESVKQNDSLGQILLHSLAQQNLLSQVEKTNISILSPENG
jgi:hypothetical protein